MRIFILVIVIISFPFVVFASCSSSGATVVYVNGILTNYSDAKKDLGTLQVEYIKNTGDYSLKFTNGYNQSHLAGAGDLIESASQLLGSSINNYDRDTILLQIYPEVTTRKILLVGHSQGTFYTNEIYNYLLKNGESKESVGVYNIATPASSVSGDSSAQLTASGKYLTSENDKVINAVRGAAFKIGAKQPLSANINIPLTAEEAANSFGGHSFSGVYLANDSARIVSDSENVLKKLVATEITNLANAGCFTPPAKSLTYYAQKSVFAVADTAAAGVVAANGTIALVGETVYNDSISALAALQNGAVIAGTFLKELVNKGINTSGLALLSEINLNNTAVAEKTNRVIANNFLNNEINQSNSPQENLNTSDTQDEDATESVAGQALADNKLPTTNVLNTNTQTASTPLKPIQVCTYNTNKTPSHQNLLINEVAWMGTANSANDEWIELKNISGVPLDISGWQLLDQGEQIKITLENKKVPAGGFLLLERTDDSSAPTITADVIYSGALSNTNEGLRLFDSDCNLIDEIMAATDWPAGISEARRTMERQINLSWNTYNGNGQTLGSLLMMGTPKAENSPAVVFQSGGVTQNVISTETNSTATAAATTTTINNDNPSTSSEQANHLVISEVQTTGGAGQTTNDFVELYNSTNLPINLNGYRLVKRTKTGTSDTSIKSWIGDEFVPAKGFYLWASSNYTSIAVAPDATTTATIADDNGIALRQGPADTGIIIDSVGWGENQSNFVEGTVFATNPGANQSLERKVFSSGCVSASGSGEFLGNSCDTNSNSSDFEIRAASNPQNSKSFPEPRSQPTVAANFNVSYSSSTMELILNWDQSKDYSESTSTIKYILNYGTSSPDTLKSLIELNSTTTYKFKINEVGTDFYFNILAKDRENLLSNATIASINAASPLTNLYFYHDTRSSTSQKYLLDFYYNNYPFVPDIYQTGIWSSWKILVFYLNKDAPKELVLNTVNNWQPANTAGVLDIRYENCTGGNSRYYSLVLPDSFSRCSNGGGVENRAFSWSNLEDPYILLELATTTSGITFTSQDFVTVAMYSLASSGGGDQKFNLAALDRNKYFFQNIAPVHQAPATPSNLSLSHNATTSILAATWDSSKDADTLDALITYQINYSTTTLSDSGWTAVFGTSLNISVEPGKTYNIALRAKDDFGDISQSVTAVFSVPETPPPYGLNNIRWGHLTSSSSVAVAFSSNPYPFMASGTPSAIIFFLNQSPPVSSSFSNFVERWGIGGVNTVLSLGYSACDNNNATILGGLLMHNSSSCLTSGSGLSTRYSRNSLTLGQMDLSTNVLGVFSDSGTITHTFSTSDYITLGFYSLSGSNFNKVAAYNKKIYFEE